MLDGDKCSASRPGRLISWQRAHYIVVWVGHSVVVDAVVKEIYGPLPGIKPRSPARSLVSTQFIPQYLYRYDFLQNLLIGTKLPSWTSLQSVTLRNAWRNDKVHLATWHLKFCNITSFPFTLVHYWHDGHVDCQVQPARTSSYKPRHILCCPCDAVLLSRFCFMKYIVSASERTHRQYFCKYKT